MLVNAHQECEIEYEQSFQALSLEEDDQNQQKSILMSKPKSQQKNTSKKHQTQITSDSSLLLVENHSAGSSSSQASNSSTSSPSSSSSLIMDAKDLYDFSHAPSTSAAAAPSSCPVMITNGQTHYRAINFNDVVNNIIYLVF